MPDDPYLSPEQIESVKEPEPSDESLTTIARSVFPNWERLRVSYNLCLFLVTLLITAGIHSFAMLAFPMYWLTVLAGAVFANLCFMAGPALETCIRWLGYRGNALRWALYLAGLLLASFLAAGTIGAIAAMQVNGSHLL